MEKILKYCEDCGAELVSFIDGQCCGLKCPKCDKIVVITTYDDSAMEDKNTYKLFLLENDYTAKKAYILSRTIKCNVNKATKLLSEKNVLAYECKAVEMKEIKKVLKDNCINFVIPNFPYE